MTLDGNLSAAQAGCIYDGLTESDIEFDPDDQPSAQDQNSIAAIYARCVSGS